MHIKPAMKTYERIVVSLCICVGVLSGWAQSSDKQFSFAESLFQEGDDSYAIIEFKRFIHYYESDPKLPQAKLFLANIFLGDIQTLGNASSILDSLSKEKSDIGDRAKALQGFLNQYSKGNKEAFVAFMDAKHQEMRNRFSDAAKRYHNVYLKHDRSTVAPLALFASAKLNLQQLNQAQIALNHLKELQKEFPKHPRKAEIEFMVIESMEKIQGSTDQVLAAYRKMGTQQPKHAFAQAAMNAVKRIEDAKYALKRAQPKENIRAFRIVSQRMESGAYTIHAEVAKAISEQELKATLEDCLFSAYEKRPQKNSKVVVRGYYTYPLTEAGIASWTPGDSLKYQIVQQEAKDVITDTIFDLFRKK